MAKVLIYYLLLVSIITSTPQLRTFLFWLALFIVATGTLPLMQQHGWIQHSDLRPLQDRAIDPETGREIDIARIQGVGIFNDPNDLSHMLAVGVILCLYWLNERRLGWRRWLWLVPIASTLRVIVLTKSRGGMLALLGSVVMLFLLRFGLRKSVVLGTLVLPALWMVAGQRQMDFSAEGGTSQQRVQTWSDSLEVFRSNPLLGAGEGSLEFLVGRVAHNSFVQAYAELGMLGGTWFLCAFVLPLWGFHRLPRQQFCTADGELVRLRPYMAASVAGYVVGMFSLSRGYAVPTYMVLGLVAIYVRQLVVAGIPWPVSHPGTKRMVLVSVGFLIVMHVMVRLLVHWKG